METNKECGLPVEAQCLHVNGECQGAQVPAHTPTPWFYVPEAAAIKHRINKHQTEYPVTGIYNSANAEFIVRAVNSHEALLEAAKGLLNELSVDRPSHAFVDQAIRDLKKAVAKAQGGN